MKRIVFAGIGLAFGLFAANAATPFDGKWQAMLVCPDWKEAKGYTYLFTGAVKDGVFHAKAEDKRDGALVMNGEIKPDGTALLKVTGKVGNPDYAIKNAPTGTPVNFDVQSKLDGKRGTGSRVAGRKCDVSFSKQ